MEEVDTVAVLLDRNAITALCKAHGVRRLVVFGSVLTDHFHPDRSDVDFLGEFDDSLNNRFDTYFDLKEGLEDLVGRPVDLVTSGALDNPYFAAFVNRSSEQLYAARRGGTGVGRQARS